ncbi:hypothetical protein J4E81_004218 [Alternaria sp. BMP 2799]|nr:hypothetical protein J4E81_004218 [Alternaria sp. BMP 2799]
MSGAKHIVFDIVGTLVSHEHFYAVIDQRLGPKLQANNISARLLGFAWLESAEREYTYLSISGSYVPFAKVFESIFFRFLHFAGVAEPRSVATEEDVKYFMQEYRNGDRPRVMGYFERGNIDIDNNHIVTCDDVGVGKPDLKAYEKLIEKIGVDSKASDLWFAAAHAWDVSAAGRAGFKTAYCSVLEKEALDDVFGKMDVVAATLPELAEKVTSQ